MRLYGGKLLKQKTEKRVRQAQEIRDAIIFDVTPASRYCRVLIQGAGSTDYIKAYYPENWESTPAYLKPGNAVRITHPGGNRGRIEIAGNGILRPTTITGQTIIITPAALMDTILTGCYLSPSNPETMSIRVAYGTYRIDEVTYTLSGMLMDRTDIEMDRVDLLMDDVGDSVTFDAAHSSQFRYDSVCIGIDGVLDVVKGANFATTGTIPDPPSAPADHLRLGWVLIPPNATEITGGLINKYYSAPAPAYLTTAIADDELSWAETSTTITVYVKDQYSNNISGFYTLTVAWLIGTGAISKNVDSQDALNSLTFSFTGSNNSFTYTRDETEPDEVSPLFSISENNPILGSTVTRIQLLNIDGDMIP